MQEQLYLSSLSSQTEGGLGTTRASSTSFTGSMKTENIPTEGAQSAIATTTQAPTSDPTTNYTLDSTGPCRSARRNKGQYSSTRYINEVFLASVQQIDNYNEYHAALLY